MKKTDLEKNKALKLAGKMAHSGVPARFGAQSVVLDRREQRKADQALGLVPFAVKLNADLIKRIQSLAAARECGLNDLVAELLTAGLDQDKQG